MTYESRVAAFYLLPSLRVAGGADAAPTIIGSDKQEAIVTLYMNDWVEFVIVFA